MRAAGRFVAAGCFAPFVATGGSSRCAWSRCEDVVAEVGMNDGARWPSEAMRFVRKLFSSADVKPRDKRLSAIVRTAELSLVALIAFLCAQLVINIWDIFAPGGMPHGEPIAISPASVTTQTADINPFGTGLATVENGSPAAVNSEQLQETTLDLTLYGAWIDNTNSTAFIGEKNGPQKRYQVGDEIADGIRLEEIHKDWVVISRGGIYEALRIKNRNAGATGSYQIADGSKNDPVNEETSSLDQIFSASISGDGRVVLRPGEDAESFASLGFLSGDILLSIDGAPLNGIQSAKTFMDRLGQNSSFSVTVERNGQPTDLKIQVKPAGAGGDDDDA